ncbi:MAG: twin-arginine translocase TatA/TatE family subunit [Candidatus Kapabacteria bacterium]|nr:twin-arginine translocase TatA/TatE family subunit [Candidatus Kapabacteria bacterium]MBX7154161.1 twin-arginine translocase TatA/TatE family subunit [Bacteroidota bacterium]
MFDVGGGELMLIIFAVLLLFGPKKIPEVAQMIGKGVRKFREAQDEFTQHIRDISTQVESEVQSVSKEVTEISSSATQTLSAVEQQYNSTSVTPQLPEPEVALDVETSINQQPPEVEQQSTDELPQPPEPEMPPPVSIKPAEGTISR